MDENTLIFTFQSQLEDGKYISGMTIFPNHEIITTLVKQLTNATLNVVTCEAKKAKLTFGNRLSVDIEELPDDSNNKHFDRNHVFKAIISLNSKRFMEFRYHLGYKYYDAPPPVRIIQALMINQSFLATIYADFPQIEAKLQLIFPEITQQAAKFILLPNEADEVHFMLEENRMIAKFIQLSGDMDEAVFNCNIIKAEDESLLIQFNFTLCIDIPESPAAN